MSEGHDRSGHKEIIDWTKAQQDQITAGYNSLHGKYQEEAKQKLFGGPQLPYEQAHSILMASLKKQEQAEGLDGKVNNEPRRVPVKRTQLDYGLGLGGIAATVAGLASVNPAITVAGILTTMYALTPKYKKAAQKAS